MLVSGQLSVVSGQLSVVSGQLWPAHAFSNPLILNPDAGSGTVRVPACPRRYINLGLKEFMTCSFQVRYLLVNGHAGTRAVPGPVSVFD